MKERSDSLWADATEDKHGGEKMDEEEEEEEQERERRGAEERYFVCTKRTHVTIVKSPRDTWLPFRGAPALCVIHVVIEESTASVGVSEQKDGPFSFFHGCGFCCCHCGAIRCRTRQTTQCIVGLSKKKIATAVCAL